MDHQNNFFFSLFKAKRERERDTNLYDLSTETSPCLSTVAFTCQIQMAPLKLWRTDWLFSLVGERHFDSSAKKLLHWEKEKQKSAYIRPVQRANVPFSCCLLLTHLDGPRYDRIFERSTGQSRFRNVAVSFRSLGEPNLNRYVGRFLRRPANLQIVGYNCGGFVLGRTQCYSALRPFYLGLDKNEIVNRLDYIWCGSIVYFSVVLKLDFWCISTWPKECFTGLLVVFNRRDNWFAQASKEKFEMFK